MPEDSARLLDLIGGNWSTQAIGAAAQLGIADRLAARPARFQDLAREVNCESSSLRRLLGALAALGLVEEDDEHAFHLTPLGEPLRSDSPRSLHAYAVWTARYQWGVWGKLVDCVRTGHSARSQQEGHVAYGHVTADAGTAATFNRAMDEVTSHVAEAVARAPFLAGARHAMDVGGGHGRMLLAILRRHTAMRGTLFDLPHAVPGARGAIADAGLSDRCDAVAGSFFEELPRDADTHVLKSVMHNWDDERCAAILARSREALSSGGRLVVVERLLPDRASDTLEDRLVLRSDLNMLVGLGGRERSLGEFESLLVHAGFALRSCARLPLGYSMLEAGARSP